MSSTQQQFRDKISKFMTRHNMDRTRFGLLAMNDPMFVFDLDKGRSPSMKTSDRVLAFMASYRKRRRA